MRTKYLHLVFPLVVLTALSCKFLPSISISAREPKIGTEIRNDNGRLANEVSIISPDSIRIVFEFFLDIPKNTDILLEFRWFYGNNLFFTSSGRFVRGYTIGFIERDPNEYSEWASGNYRVEV